jgi:dnd system-associated protein 4
MSESIEGRDSVAIDENVYEIYKQLTDGTDPERAPFRTMKDVFMWAVSEGYRRGRRPLIGKRVSVFKWAQFSPQVDVPLLRAIAIANTKGITVLASQDEVLRIAEEYANSGIHELSTRLLQADGQPLWNLVNSTMELFESNKA